MTQPTVFVIILNWNLKDDTIACVESVLASSYSPYQVVVVDNASTDGSVSDILAHFGEKVDLIVNETNVGFAAGVNVGIRYALDKGADWILLLNNDTIIASDMVAQLIKAAVSTQESRVGILSPIIYYYDQPNKVWRIGDWHPRWSPIPIRIPSVVLRIKQKPFFVDYVTGCGMLIQKEVFHKVGLFDPNYFMYYEDADFCLRARKAGFSLLCVPTAKMWHKVSKSTYKNIGYQQYLRTRYRVQFYKLHYSWIAWLYVILSIWLMICRQVLKGNFTLAHYYLKGFYHGWRQKGY